MSTVITHDFTKFDDTFVFHFGTEDHTINAETLSQSLLGLSNAIKFTEAKVNFGNDIILVIESTGEGSFKVVSKLKRWSKDNLFSSAAAASLVLGLVGSAIWKAIDPETPITVISNDNEYIVQRGNERIILPKEAAEYYDDVTKDKSIRKEIGKTFTSVEKDPTVSSISFHSSDNNTPELVVRRESFGILSREVNEVIEPESNEVDVELVITKAIFVVSKRKWEFRWGTRPISAPVLDDEFYTQFNAHTIVLGVGDILQVRLRIITQYDSKHDINIEKGFEVIKVFKHIAKS